MSDELTDDLYSLDEAAIQAAWVALLLRDSAERLDGRVSQAPVVGVKP